MSTESMMERASTCSRWEWSYSYWSLNALPSTLPLSKTLGIRSSMRKTLNTGNYTTKSKELRTSMTQGSLNYSTLCAPTYPKTDTLWRRWELMYGCSKTLPVQKNSSKKCLRGTRRYRKTKRTPRLKQARGNRKAKRPGISENSTKMTHLRTNWASKTASQAQANPV